MFSPGIAILEWSIAEQGSSNLSINSDLAHRRAEALFKKKEQAHEGHQAMTEYHAALDAMREKTTRLRALRLARDGKQKTPKSVTD